MTSLTVRGTQLHLRPGRAGPADDARGPVTAQSPMPSGTASTSPRVMRLPAVGPLQLAVLEHDRDGEAVRHRRPRVAWGGDVDAEERVGRRRQAAQQLAGAGVQADVHRLGRGERLVAHGGQHDVEAEPEVRLVARGRGDRPLQQDREVGGLLHLDEEHARAGGVRLARGHEDAVAGPHVDLVEVRQHPRRVLGVDLLGQQRRVDVLAEPDPHGRVVALGLEHVPGLGLAVAGVQVVARERPGRVDVHGQPLARVEQLDQQADVGGTGRGVRRARPADRVGRDQVGEQRRRPAMRLRPTSGSPARCTVAASHSSGRRGEGSGTPRSAASRSPPR